MTGANSSCTGYPYYADPYFDYSSSSTGSLVVVANSTAANIEMGVDPSDDDDEQGVIYGYSFPTNMTVQTLGSSYIQAQNSNWNIWTNITWPQQESQVMGAGVLGLGLASNSSSGSVWSYGSGLCDPSNPNFGVVQLQYYKLAEWDWANVPLQRPFENNVTLCASTNSANYLTTFNSTSFGPQSTYFAFGQINSTEDIFMQNLLGANSTASVTISTQEVGLGLSPDLFRKFVNLVSIASEGTLSCPGSDLGLPCIIPFGCDQLPASMFFSFCVDDCSATGKNITVPLATFASPV